MKAEQQTIQEHARPLRHFFSATADIRLFVEVMFTVRGATVDCR